jgi:membrane peptidoglycan carboxypeptidase
MSLFRGTMGYPMRKSRGRRAPGLLIAFALLAASCAQLNDLPRLTEEDVAGISLAQSSKVYADDRTLITTLHGTENRTIVPLEQMSETFIDAVIAIEDARFWEHEGVDLRAIARAFLSNVSSGRIEEGGSTITQQYVKTSIIAPGETAERTLERKINEAALSRQLEKELGKEEILRRYLNTVYFGYGAYGVQAAAKTYFDKSARKLGLRESALLAGLIQAPGDYDPFDRRGRAKQRRNVVIDRMEKLEYVTSFEAEEAKSKKLGLRPKQDTERYPAPYFMDYIHRLITYDPRFEAIGKTPEQREQQLFQGGLRIHTTLDLEDQTAAEEAVKGILTEERDPYGALVSIDPNTGEIKAMVGGRDWFVPRKKDSYAKVNLAIAKEPNLSCERNRKGRCKEPFEPGPAPGTGRHAGSAFKPFALTQAIKEGIPLNKRYKAPSCIDLRVPETGQPWRPCNYESGAFGQISLLDATIKSVNTVFAQLILEVSKKGATELAAEMGVSTPLADNPSSVLGTNEVNPLGMASGFGTLAANGTHHPPIAIKRIVDADGKVIYRDESEESRVLDPGVAYLVTGALQQVIQRGTGTRAQPLNRPAAGKTGTAQEYRDAWFVGYTPDLVTAVWVGYPAGQIEMKLSCSAPPNKCLPTRIQVTGGSWPAEIWTNFMIRALSDVPVSNFRNPGLQLVKVTIDDRNGCLAGRFTPKQNRVEAELVKGTEPDKPCREKGDAKKVPDVFGFPVDEAVRILKDEGFDVKKQSEESTTYPPGRVIDQSPGAGQKAPKNSTVTITVSVAAKKKCKDVPNVLGLKEGAARKRINDAGFDVNTIYQKESNKDQAQKRKGRVWKQSPSSGTCAEKGSKVDIWVNP